MHQAKSNTCTILFAVLTTAIAVGFLTCFAFRARAHDDSMSVSYKKIVQYNCEQSGGIFRDGICDCKHSMYDGEIGYCVDSFGAPGGNLAEATRRLRELQTVKN